jgi:hypothetical protein
MMLIPSLWVKTCRICGLQISDIRDPGNAGYENIDDRAYHSSIGRVRQHQAKEVVDLTQQFLHPTLKEHYGVWLDIGCSVGNLLMEAKHAGFKVLGVEPDPIAYEQARLVVGQENVYCGTFNGGVLLDCSADVVSTVDVLEHIPVLELSDFEDIVCSKLNKGGVWVIKVPSSDGLYFKIIHWLTKFRCAFIQNIIKRIWSFEYKYPHTVYFNAFSLNSFLESHRFKILAHRYLQELPIKTVLNRITVDEKVPKFQAILFAPAFLVVNLIERIRGKSDALFVCAQRR